MTVLEERTQAMGVPELSPEAELAVLARALYRVGYSDRMTGHITVRHDGDLLTLPLELGWNEVRASDIVRIDHDGNQLAGKWGVTPAITLHVEFHKLVPGCHVAIHQHPRYGAIWAAMRQRPPSYDQRSAAIPDDDIAVYDDYEGPVNAVDAAQAAVRSLNGAPMALLANHGVFVTAESAAQAYERAEGLEVRCRLAYEVHTMGGGHPMAQPGVDALVHVTRTTDGAYRRRLWHWAIRQELTTDPTTLH